MSVQRSGGKWLVGLGMLAVAATAALPLWAGDKSDDGRESGIAFLGVRLSEETENSEGGARVDSVVEDSPAEAAGIQDGDVIVGFDGKVVRGPLGLTERIHASKVGQQVSVKLLRSGREKTVVVDLGSRRDVEGPHAFALAPDGDEGHWQDWADKWREWGENWSKHAHKLGPGVWALGESRPKLGVQLIEMTPELRRHFGGKEDVGVLVSKVLSGTPAEQAGLRVGDLIVSIDGEPVAEASDMVRELEDKDGQTFVIEVVRDHRPVKIEVAIPEPEEHESGNGPRAYMTPLPPPPPPPRRPHAPPAPPAPPAPASRGRV